MKIDNLIEVIKKHGATGVLAFCKKCLKECRPLYSKADAEAAFNERSCEGVREAATK